MPVCRICNKEFSEESSNEFVCCDDCKTGIIFLQKELERQLGMRLFREDEIYGVSRVDDV